MQLRADQPIVADGKQLFVAAGEAIYALNADDGKEAWVSPAGTLTAPLLVQDGWIVAASGHVLTALRAADGTKVWSRDTGAAHQRPTVEGDNLYLPLDDSRLVALDLRTGAERWTRRFADKVSEVLAFADRVYLGATDTHLGKQFFCLDAGDGSTSWHWRIGTTVRGRPAADDSRIFVTAMDNMVRAFDRHSGALLWHPAVPYRPTTGPVIIGSSVIIPGASAELRAFAAASGRPAGEIKLEQPLAVPPAFAGSGSEVVMAAITGSLNGEWKLLLAAPPAPQAPHE